MDLDQRNDRSKYSNKGGVERSPIRKYVPWIILGVIVIILWSSYSWVKNTYNEIITTSEYVDKAWGGVQTAYQARADKVKNLTKIVKGAADFEKSTLTEVIEARSKATSVTIDPANLTPESLAKFEAAQGQLTQALSKLLVTVERYPDLKAVQSFRDFQVQYEGIENRIKKARDDFNEAIPILMLK